MGAVQVEVEYVEVARASSQRGEVVLRRRLEAGAAEGAPTVLELRVNGVFVMDSSENASEVAMARVALERCPVPRHVLVGGLGLGFTTHEVLADHRVEQVVVAEIEESLVRWFRDGTIRHGTPYLADERLRLRVGDVRQVVAEATPESFDLILLDVDNGPTFLVYEENAAIYQPAFLHQTLEVLRPGGVVVVWSSTDDDDLTAAITEVFGTCTVESHPVRLQDRDDTYWLHVGQKS